MVIIEKAGKAHTPTPEWLKDSRGIEQSVEGYGSQAPVDLCMQSTSSAPILVKLGSQEALLHQLRDVASTKPGVALRPNSMKGTKDGDCRLPPRRR